MAIVCIAETLPHKVNLNYKIFIGQKQHYIYSFKLSKIKLGSLKFKYIFYNILMFTNIERFINLSTNKPKKP